MKLPHQSLDASFDRGEEQTGTDVFIIDFNKGGLSQNWESEIIKYTVDSFFYAIYHNKISLTAGGRELSKNTLQSIIDNIVCQSKSFPEHAEQYYKVLTSNSDKAKEFEKEITTPGRAGKLILKLLVDDELTFRRIAMIRNTGMKIFDKKNICGSINFAGVLVVEGEELNHYLKTMEDATHESWSESNTDNPTEAKRFLSEIHNFCKESLNSLIEVHDGEVIDSGLGDFLPIDVTADDDNKRNMVESINPAYRKISNDPEKKHKKRKRIIRNLEMEPEDGAGEDAEEVVEDESSDVMTGGSPSDTSNEAGGNQGGGPGETPGNAPSKVLPQKIPVSFIKFKALCCDAARGGYRIVLVPQKTLDNCTLVLNMITSTNDSVAPQILAAEKAPSNMPLAFQRNQISGLSFEKNVKVTVDVMIDYTDYCSIEGEAYGLAK